MNRSEAERRPLFVRFMWCFLSAATLGSPIVSASARICAARPCQCFGSVVLRGSIAMHSTALQGERYGLSATDTRGFVVVFSVGDEPSVRRISSKRNAR